MNKKKAKLNILIIIIAVILVVSVLLIRFEFNPFSYFVGQDQEEEELVSLENLNGFYVYKEDINKNLTVFSGCSISYFNNYLVVVNDDYYLYRSSCIGTFYKGSGNTKDLKFNNTLENTKYITFNGKDYYKNDYIDYVNKNNYVEDNSEGMLTVYPENYKFLFEEAMQDYFFELEGLSFKMSSNRIDFNLVKNDDGLINLQMVDQEDILYSVNVDKFEMLPNLKSFANNLTIIEALSNGDRYNYQFKVLTKQGFVYNLNDKFPIKVDSVVLTTDNSVFVKYNPSEDNFVMLVGRDKKFCVEDSESNDIAYYVFNINYNYSIKGFDKPEFIRIVYERDGCNYVNEVMGW